ncbi:MAG: hypothetical protein MJ252_10120 [archaeon]|nr:hypothetical protein [archaeon]
MADNLNIKDLHSDVIEAGNLFKSSKAIFKWEFTLDNNPYRIELQHSRIKGKRIVLINGKETSNSTEYTYSYSFSFPIDKHYITIIQVSPDQYDLRIDNLSFVMLLNKQEFKKFECRENTRVEKPKPQQYNFGFDNKKEEEPEDDFFGGGKKETENNSENFFSIGANKKNFDFDFGDSSQSGNNPSNTQTENKGGNDLLDFDFGGGQNTSNVNQAPNTNINQSNTQQSNNPFDMMNFGQSNTNNTMNTGNTQNNNGLLGLDFFGSSSPNQPSGNTMNNQGQFNFGNNQTGNQNINFNINTSNTNNTQMNQQGGINFNFNSTNTNQTQNQNINTQPSTPFDFQF